MKGGDKGQVINIIKVGDRSLLIGFISVSDHTWMRGNGNLLLLGLSLPVGQC